MFKKLSILFSFLFLVLTIGGCGASEDQSPSTTNQNSASEDSQFVEYGVAGRIVEITVSEDESILGSILVEGSEENGATYTEALVTITSDTKIYKNELSSFEDLTMDMYVNVFFQGDVKESFPVQATAKQINIIPDDAK
ncbi:hypothetical protein CR203_08530 [Salipaludibacillus neizhouensis]|uniref:DUF3221 domain-containing protein n=1 Tax=Salipaludibacillus neizhouensis TaxID=885475 RepID=A0A3A9K505_9BACI|nr:DUF3221 domain-containing protein [Salipaludibacillus neizhouensis]RKL67399.1 hypothetical protein CR203_08530 [Salipaludibacillus neizhouensis]